MLANKSHQFIIIQVIKWYVCLPHHRTPYADFTCSTNHSVTGVVWCGSCVWAERCFTQEVELPRLACGDLWSLTNRRWSSRHPSLGWDTRATLVLLHVDPRLLRRPASEGRFGIFTPGRGFCENYWTRFNPIINVPLLLSQIRPNHFDLLKIVRY